MLHSIAYVYQYLIFLYAITIMAFYLFLALFGYINIVRTKMKYTKDEEDVLDLNIDKVPGISVIAGAFNEEVIIIDNVSSLLNLNYPKFEVVIVNDGSKDKTLDLLIEKYELEEVPFPKIYKVRCQPMKRLFKSANAMYKNLTVVDKINGGTKADAMNAGINVAQYDYFINTDVDCLLHKDTLRKVILPVLDSKIQVIAVGATMRMSNGCEVKEGAITRVRPPRAFIPTFQETEYLRSYLIAKMGWSVFNAIPNVSGGFGLFNKSVVINAGGYDPLSHAEDMDMMLRMTAYMRNNKEKYRIVQIPDTCCWTEGPPNVRVLNRQRSRWGRGLLQIFINHRYMLFNRKQGRIGMFVLPYSLIYEFLAPIIEFAGILFLIFLLITKQVNFNTLWLMLLFVYILGITMSFLTIGFDLLVKKQYNTIREYLRLFLFSSFEAILYHPLVVVFTLRGYWQFLTRKELKWGTMTRQGFTKKPTDPLQS